MGGARGRGRGNGRWTLAVVVVGAALGGCAEGIALDRSSPLWSSDPSSLVIAGAVPEPLSLAQGSRDARTSGAAASSPKSPPAPRPPERPEASEQAAADEPYDPFATEQDAVEEYDPWETFNSAMFEVNRKIDKYALKPLAQGYNYVMPNSAQKGVQNFFHNLRMGPRLLNNLFQGKVQGAGTELGRFLLNTTFGLGGFFDVAKYMQMQTPDEDFGQTLGTYGVPPGPYVVLPLLPPLTLRDFTGYLMDLALDPLNWVVFPLIEVKNVPSLVAHKNRDTTSIVQLGGRFMFIVNERSLNLETFQGVEEATVDLYSAVRNAYLQQRAKAIKE